MTPAPTIHLLLERTDWAALKEQKLALVEVIAGLADEIASLHGRVDMGSLILRKGLQDYVERLDGLLHWIDALQDAAAREGFPVQFLTEEENDA